MHAGLVVNVIPDHSILNTRCEVPTVKIRWALKAFFSSYRSDKEGEKLALSVKVPSPFHAVLIPAGLPFLHIVVRKVGNSVGACQKIPSQS